MSPQPPAWLSDLSVSASGTKTMSAAGELARATKSRWLRGEVPDAKAALREHPELLEDRSLALDLAYEEYCLRTEAGEQIDNDAFCERFSALRYSLAKQLAVHVQLEQLSGALETPTGNWPEAGETLLGFTLVEELGRGGFARVFLAREAALGDRPVVLKITQRPTGEAEVLGRLRHRNVVPVYSVHHDPGTSKSAVCMPYLGRATLFEVLDTAFVAAAPPRRASVIMDVARAHTGPNAPDDGWQQADGVLSRATYVDGVVHLIAQVAEALHYTHSQGICHGDLKPSNILLGWDGTPLLLDFNLSFDHHGAESALGGTIPYMSPEQLRATFLGQRHEAPVDVRSDVFSLAVILYELLTGKDPFGRVSWKGSPRQSAEHLLEQQQHGPRSLRGANPHVDPKLARVVEQCLAVDPDKRLQSAAELAAALRRALTPLRRARRWTIRHRYLTAAAASLILLLSLGSVGYVASLPPRSERFVHEALAAIAAQNWADVVKDTSRAIDCDPNDEQAYFLRGYAYQQLKQWHAAINDFNRFEELKHDGSGYASVAYCNTLAGWNAQAIYYYKESIAAGYRSAAVLNNFGHHLLRQPDWDKSQPYLEEAIQADPNLQAPLHTLALLELKKSEEPGWSPEKGLQWIREAEQVAPPTAALCLDGARLCMAGPSVDEGRAEQAFAYLRKAVALGLERTRFPTRDFAALEDRPEFKTLQAQLPSGPEIRPLFYIDPVRQMPQSCWSCSAVIASAR